MYVLGGVTTGLTGHGTLSGAAIAAVLATLTTIPASVSTRAGTPQILYGAGHLTLGTPDGWLPVQHLDHSPMLLWPLPEGVTRVGYSLAPGVVLSVQLATQTAPAASSVEPWDRSASAVSGFLLNDYSPHDTTTRWTYTVPTGKRLWIASAHAYVVRRELASASVQCGAWITAGGQRVVSIMGPLPSVGAQLVGPVGGVGLTLAAGQSVEGLSYCSCTGGRVNFAAYFVGYTYTA